ncbi:MAG: DUF1588 domain-containing protein [Lentisphaeraceae bacterium]|nr:DUF1588 domain-containing protein [Lentisphaeraceae bacterium]
MKLYLHVFVIFSLCFTQAMDSATFEKSVKPIIEKYCYKCHDEDVQKGDLRLDEVLTEDHVIQHRKEWLRVLEQIKSKEMPPKKPYLPQAELDTVVKWLDNALHNYDWSKIKNPGYVSLARLTNKEYTNSVEDVFRINFHKKSAFIKDAEGDSGFTNDRDNLGMSISSLNKYFDEASKYAEAFLAYKNETWSKSFKLGKGDKPAMLRNNKSHTEAIDFPFTGVYKMCVNAQASRKNVTGFMVMINNVAVHHQSVSGEKAQVYEFPVFVEKGAGTVVIHFSATSAAIYNDGRIQHKVKGETIREISKAARAYPRMEMPAKYKGKKDYQVAYREINGKLQKAYRGIMAVDVLLKQNPMPDDRSQLYGLSRVLECKKAEVIFKKSGKEMRQWIAKEIGRDLVKECRQASDRYYEKFNKLYGKDNDSLDPLNLYSFSFTGPFLSKNSQDPKKYLSMPKTRKSAETIIRYLAIRAFRKKVTNAELIPILKVYDLTFKETRSYDVALRDSLISLLTSPYFLLLRNDLPEKGTEIDDFQKVSRLSYFLWQTVPDVTLLRAANTAKINDPKVLRQQLQRMISSDKFDSFCRSFTHEWLNINGITGVSGYLKEQLRKEPELLFRKIFKENRNIFELIDPNYTFLNQTLAKKYGISGVKGDEMRLVKLRDKRRGGLLTMGGILNATSLPERTSPVIRGAWIVETIFGEELPLPPDDVAEIPAKNKSPKTVRQILEQHRKDPSCAGCHSRIDPYGFALENYDPIGRWREKEEGNHKPIDSSMILKSGQKTKSVAEFKSYLMRYKKDDIRRNLVERVLAFALGRKLQYYDEPAIQKIIAKVKANGDKSFFLIEAVVQSYPFLNQQLQKENL